ncbi:alpha/beta fold hydrolase [Kutzneria kofuensis]|uniref:Pimeloyl-ACP methyl ester carboxylesterase n=1 Tax=Kutzneria kofuensis TaxID=103725 RepID=A0A7W9KKT3_9PSEU|nr:alpha/beta hydrolase [Kutzneria kofuensis]MBB5894389.1 pimeloyl-ACP methyl ester carboxylesterase [Kutzneria kofuensis]
METVTSKDGTSIAYERIGQGPVLALVGGAFMTRHSFGAHAQALAAEFEVVTYDRRGRGGSTITPPYAVEREIEDLAAVVDAVGASFVHGMSSGAALAFLAAAAGLPVRRLSGMEPPYRVAGAPPVDPTYGPILESLTEAGRYDEVVAHFMINAVGQPPEAVDQLKASPMWPDLVALAPTLVHDNAVMGDALPPASLSRIPVPTLVISSTGSAPFLQSASAAAASLIPDAVHVQRDGAFHDLPPETLAAALTEFFKQ